MHIETIIVGPLQTNCYVIWTERKEAIIIDPGAGALSIIELIKKKELSVSAYMLTHGHFDHICALADLYEVFPAPVGVHALDLKWAFNDSNQMPPFYSVPARPSKIERILEDGQKWTDGGLTYEVISTPGHSPGSVSFLFSKQNILFSGDTLFAGSIGRTDFPGGDPDILNQSLKTIMQLPDDTIVYPGHEASTNIKREKESNPYLHYPVFYG